MQSDLRFERFCEAANDRDEAKLIVSELGGLASWIVRRNVLEAAAEHLDEPALVSPPEPSSVHGACMVVIAGNGIDDSQTILQEAFLLPLHWRQGDVHDARLPDALVATAQHVLEVLDLNGYGLHLMHPGDEVQPRGKLWPDLDASQLDFSSAFAPLAAALCLYRFALDSRRSPLAVDRLTISTGCWKDSGGIGQVDAIELKTRAVIRFAAHTSRNIDWFVPITQRNQAQQVLDEYPGASCSVRCFKPAGDARRALSTLLASSGVAPDQDGDLDAAVAHYQFLKDVDPEEAKRYYDNDLFPLVVHRCAVDSAAFSKSPPRCLISTVSTPALIAMAVELFSPETVVILYTRREDQAGGEGLGLSDFEQRARDAEELARRAGAARIERCGFCDVPGASGEDHRSALVREMKRVTAPYLDEFPGGSVMWDMTSGTKLFNFVMLNSLARPGDWMLYIKQEWSGQRDERIPLTESAILWQHGSRW